MLRWTFLMLVLEAFVLWIFASRLATPQPMRVYFELTRRLDTVGLPMFGLAAAIAFACSLRPWRAGLLAGWAGAHPVTLSAAALLVYATGTLFVFQRHPISMDEYLPLFQSRAFASGALHGSAPPELIDAMVPRQFQGSFFQVNRETGAVASRYWPAFALLQAPLAVFGANWLFNPLIGALLLPALDALLRRLGVDRESRGAALLATMASSAIAFNAMSFYAMPLLLLCNVVYTRLILETRARALFGAGLVGAVALTALNPVPHALYAAPWIVWTVLRGPGGVRRIAWLALGYAPLGLALGAGWPLAYGHFAPQQDALAGGGMASMLAVFSWPSIQLIVSRILALAKLDLWAVPGLVAMAIAGAFVWRTAAARCLALSGALTLIGYLFVPFDQGHGWGYRYFHHAWLVLPALAAGALSTLDAGARARRAALAFAVTGSLACTAVLLPLRAVQIRDFVRDHLAQIPPRAPGSGRQLVFIDASCGYYAVDLVQNDPFLRGDQLRFASLGADQDRRIAEALLAQPVISARTACATRWISR